ncbi:MAG: hypothetical protein ACI8TX_002527, partial [Hyphomicrobiaceae bacterium]
FYVHFPNPPKGSILRPAGTVNAKVLPKRTKALCAPARAIFTFEVALECGNCTKVAQMRPFCARGVRGQERSAGISPRGMPHSVRADDTLCHPLEKGLASQQLTSDYFEFEDRLDPFKNGKNLGIDHVARDRVLFSIPPPSVKELTFLTNPDRHVTGK